MIEVRKKEECSGCFSCFNICPKKCIEMESDSEGFKYPIIEKKKCINCELCKKVCPQIQRLERYEVNIKAYACKNKNENIRVDSSSGGIFFKLCEYVINNGGVVFGAAFTEQFILEHSYAEDIESCEKFRGSKYVQSEIGSMYRKAEEFLKDNRMVLFSGTQCQIKGLNLFLNKKYQNLICIDIICHGVPSPLVFKKYINKLELKYNSKIDKYSFRDKEKGWKNFSTNIKFKNGKIYSNKFINDIYMKGFLKDLYLRPSCYECKSKNFTNGSDISLADYWGIEKIHPQFDDDRGVSLILINSDKGINIFNAIIEDIDYLESNLEYSIQNNPCIIRPIEYNLQRDRFFKLIKKDDIEKVIVKCTKEKAIKSYFFKIKIKVSLIKNKLLNII